jgi:flagellar motor switch protein FliM
VKISKKHLDRLIQESQGQSPVSSSASASVVPFELGKQNRIIRGRLPGMESVYDRYARMLAQTLTQSMRRSVTVNRRATELVNFKDALMVMEQRLVHVIIDLMFGGNGLLQSSPGKRDFTGIETRMIGKIAKNAVEDLETAWKKVSTLQARFERLETHPKFTNIVPEEEVVVTTTFDVLINRMTTTLSICVPYLMLDPIRAKLEGSYALEDNQVNQLNVSRLSENLLRTKMELCVQLGESRVALRKFLKLEVGDHLLLDQDQEGPLKVKIGNVLKFRGFQGAYKGRNALKISELIHPKDRFTDALENPSKSSETE